MPHVLIVEDDAAIRTALTRALRQRDHAVSSVGAGADALREAVARPPDVIVLDLMLPDVPGAEVLRLLRGSSNVPIIIATARDEETEIVRLLRAGADDYVVKPFSADQLDARIRAVLRRSRTEEGPAVVEVGELTVDPRGRTVRLQGRDLELTPKEFDLLLYLAERPGTVVPKRELLAQVWRLPYGGADKTVDVHLSWLRRKLGESADAPRYLHTVRGAGIKLRAPES